MSYEIVPATPAHLRALAYAMRPMDRAEIEGMGLRVRPVLRNLYSTSLVSRTAIVDGEVAAVWGVQGAMLGDSGTPWLFTTPAVERAKMAFLREARREVAAMLQTRRTLRTMVLASYTQSIRFFECVGFSFSEPFPSGPHGRLYRLMTVNRGASHPPFIVYALGRSRSAWLARFLSYGGWTCHHEAAIGMRSIENVVALFKQPNIGTVETAAAHGWHILHHHIPELRVVVVRRPVEEVVNSMMALDLGDAFAYDRDALTRTIARAARELDRISAQPGVLTVDFADLIRSDVCAAVFEHCLSFKMPHAWWSELKDTNIQVDVKSLLAYYHQNLPEIEEFKRTCKAELRRLAYARLLKAA